MPEDLPPELEDTRQDPNQLVQPWKRVFPEGIPGFDETSQTLQIVNKSAAVEAFVPTVPPSKPSLASATEPTTALPIPSTLQSTPAKERTLGKGRYEVRRLIAQGGMGRIWEGYDRLLQRSVAIKEILQQQSDLEKRFFREALITARLEHPGIVPLHDLGENEQGEPFYTMKLVSGRPLHEVIQEQKTLAERIKLLPSVISICEAMAYAHARHVVHRDLKPQNVLIADYGESVVIDWGLARALEEKDIQPRGPDFSAINTAGLTDYGTVMGTPQYMPLEQARAEAVDARADVYALGAILYHCLAGVAPYHGEGKSNKEVLLEVLQQPPTNIEHHVPELPKALAAIVHKAMARERQDRYQSAQELAEDLLKFQSQQVVSAYHYSPWAKAKLLAKRHKLTVIVASLLSIVILFSFFLLFKQRNKLLREKAKAEELRVLAENALQQADQQTTAAKEARKEASLFRQESLSAQQKAAYALDQNYINQANTEFLRNNPQRAIAWLKKLSGQTSTSQLAALLLTELRYQGTLFSTQQYIFSKVPLDIAVSRDKNKIYSLLPDGTLYLWNRSDNTNSKLASLPADVQSLSLSADNNKLAVAANRQAILIDLSTQKQTRTKLDNQLRSLQFQDNTTLLVVLTDGSLLSWNGNDSPPSQLPFSVSKFTQLAFSSTSRQLLAVETTTEVALWNLDTGERKLLREAGSVVTALAFSAKGKNIALGTENGEILFFGQKGEFVSYQHPSQTAITALQFSQDVSQLFIGGQDGSLYVLSLLQAKTSLLEAHRSKIRKLLLADGSLFSSSDDKSIRIWETLRWTQNTEKLPLLTKPTFSADGHWLISLQTDGSLARRNIDSKTTQNIVPISPISVFTVSTDGSQIAYATQDGSIVLWSSQENKLQQFAPVQTSWQLLSLGANSIVAATQNNIIRIDISTGKIEILQGPTRKVLSLQTQNTRTVAGCEDGSLWYWDASTQGHSLSGTTQPITQLALSPDENYIATGNTIGEVRLWSIADNSSQKLYRHKNELLQLQWKQNVVVSLGKDKTLHLTEVESTQGISLSVDPASTLAVTENELRLLQGNNLQHWPIAPLSATALQRFVNTLSDEVIEE